MSKKRRFGDHHISEIRTADIEDFVADMKTPRMVSGIDGQRLAAALYTGMRRGEMLALRFGDIDWQARRIVLRGATTKSRKTRVAPIGTTRLMAVQE